MASIYDFTLKTGLGEDFPLEQNRGKVMLIVNTATGCGFTPQYEPIEAMYEKYHDQGFEVIDIPCNQFMDQAPGTDEDGAAPGVSVSLYLDAYLKVRSGCLRPKWRT